MKKLFFVLANLVFLLTLEAQSGVGGFHIGPRIGGGWQAMDNVNWVNPEGSEHMVVEEDILGTMLGLEIGYDFWETNFGVKSGYYSKVYKYVLNVAMVNPGTVHGEYTIRTTEIPLIFELRTEKGNKRNTMKAFGGGPYFEFGAQLQQTQSVEIETYVGTEFENKSSEDLTAFYNKQTYGAVLGIGVIHFSRTRFQIRHGIRATYTLGDFLGDQDHVYFKAQGFFPGWSDDYKPTRLFSLAYMFSINIRLFNAKKH